MNHFLYVLKTKAAGTSEEKKALNAYEIAVKAFDKKIKALNDHKERIEEKLLICNQKLHDAVYTTDIEPLSTRYDAGWGYIQAIENIGCEQLYIKTELENVVKSLRFFIDLKTAIETDSQE